MLIEASSDVGTNGYNRCIVTQFHFVTKLKKILRKVGKNIINSILSLISPFPATLSIILIHEKIRPSNCCKMCDTIKAFAAAGCAAVKVALSFAVILLFNVALPTFDTYSDIHLLTQTFQFDLGSKTENSLELFGCRECYRRGVSFRNVENHCPICIDDTFGDDGVFCVQYPKPWQKIAEMQQMTRDDKECRKKETVWNWDYASNNLTEDARCSSDECCISINHTGRPQTVLHQPLHPQIPLQPLPPQTALHPLHPQTGLHPLPPQTASIQLSSINGRASSGLTTSNNNSRTRHLRSAVSGDCKFKDACDLHLKYLSMRMRQSTTSNA